MKKKINLLLIFALLSLVLFVGSSIYADILDYNTPITSTGSGSTKLDNSVRGVWTIIKTVLQVSAVGVFLFAGLRYMMASADQKAEIKKSMTTLVIGATITFAASTIIPYIVTVVKQLLLNQD